jgi:hypothetical protein
VAVWVSNTAYVCGSPVHAKGAGWSSPQQLA